MSEKFKWWGYIHINGTIQVKRFFDIRDIYDAQESPFVLRIVEPFKANGRNEAIDYIKNKLRITDMDKVLYSE